MALTNAQRQRANRQESLRELLAEQCRVQHIIDNLVKIEELDEHEETFQNSLSKLKVANEQRLKILNKYLPDLKAVELEGNLEHSGSLQITWQK